MLFLNLKLCLPYVFFHHLNVGKLTLGLANDILCRSALKVCGDSTPLDLFVEQIEVSFLIFPVDNLVSDSHCIYLQLIAATILILQLLNAKYGCKVPLILLNSVETHDETLKVKSDPIPYNYLHLDTPSVF